MFYQKNKVDVYNLLRIPDNSEINLKDLITCSRSGDPEPLKELWIPVDNYYHTSAKESGEEKIAIQINSKIKYQAKDKRLQATSFLNSGQKFILHDGALSLRKRIPIDYFALLSLVISLAAVSFSWFTYQDQKYDSEITKNPIWKIIYNTKEETLEFQSPSESIQLQEGYVMFIPSRNLSGQFMYMPNMKISLMEFNKRYIKNFEKLPREKDAYVFGANRIFDTVAVLGRYAYKGEVRYKAGLYKIFIDAKIPSVEQKLKKPEIVIRGASFLRFLTDEETLKSALIHNLKNEPTEEDDWVKFLGY